MHLSFTEIGWMIIVPLIGAFSCAHVAHKKLQSPMEEEYHLYFWQNQSFYRNFFLNSNFALIINLMYLFSGKNLDLAVALLIFFMIFSASVISYFLVDIPRNVNENYTVKKCICLFSIAMAAIIVASVFSPSIISFALN